MLTENQEKYLLKIPEDKKVKIVPYNPRVKEVVVDIKSKITKEGIDLEVAHMGASALGISGQGDIDLYILCKEEDFDAYAPRLEKLFGSRVSGISIYEWQLSIDGFEIEILAKVSSEGVLYGGIGPQKIAQELKNAGFEIKKTQVVIPGVTIKELGQHKAIIKFEHALEAEVDVLVIEDV